MERGIAEWGQSKNYYYLLSPNLECDLTSYTALHGVNITSWILSTTTTGLGYSSVFTLHTWNQETWNQYANGAHWQHSIFKYQILVNCRCSLTMP